MHVRVEVTELAEPLRVTVRARPEQVMRRVRLTVARHFRCRLALVVIDGTDLVLLRERRVSGEVIVERVRVGQATPL